MTCPLCEKRRTSRFCPALSKDICAQCCGREREVTISCPFECPYLEQARDHEKQRNDAKGVPYPDSNFDSRFFERRFVQLAITGRALLMAAHRERQTVDKDLQAALESLVTTYRTLESGLVYEAFPEHNAVARRIFGHFREILPKLEAEEKEQMPALSITDQAIRECLIYMSQLAYILDNQRPKGRAFYHMLWRQFGPVEEPQGRPFDPGPGGLIIPG